MCILIIVINHRIGHIDGPQKGSAGNSAGRNGIYFATVLAHLKFILSRILANDITLLSFLEPE